MNPATVVPAGKEVATLAGGCFWCLEAVFDQMKGVASVESGYMGGRTHNPTYEEVCGGDTGHAEVVQITYEPSVVTFKELLEVFFVIHDPTTLNYQGNDFGTQYRSAIFYHSPQQQAAAGEVIAKLDASVLTAQIDQMQAAYDLAVANLEGDTPERLDVAVKDVKVPDPQHGARKYTPFDTGGPPDVEF